MAGRIRSLKPEWLDDERMAALSDEARVLSIAVIALADDYGRGRAGTIYLAGQVWAAHADGKARVTRALAELAACRYVLVYSVDGQDYYEIRNWAKHQRVDNAGRPRVPGPPTANQEVAADFAASRGEIPRVAAVRGGSPLDLRSGPPTSDLRPPIERPPDPEGPSDARAIPGTTEHVHGSTYTSTGERRQQDRRAADREPAVAALAGATSALVAAGAPPAPDKLVSPIDVALEAFKRAYREVHGTEYAISMREHLAFSRMWNGQPPDARSRMAAALDRYVRTAEAFLVRRGHCLDEFSARPHRWLAVNTPEMLSDRDAATRHNADLAIAAFRRMDEAEVAAKGGDQ